MYKELLIECIKCHHNDIALYIKDILDAKGQINNKKTEEFDEKVYDCTFMNNNYSLFPTLFDQNYSFYYFCKYNYQNIVDILIQSTTKSIETNSFNSNFEDSIRKASNYNEIDVIYVLFSSKDEIKDIFFQRNKNLNRIAIPSSIKSIGKEAFSECSSLSHIVIPSSVISIGKYAFLGCKSLRNITIPSSVHSIGKEAFFGCSSLTYVEIKGLIKSIEFKTFAGCSSLIQITIPSFVTSIEDGAFSGCLSLDHITIPSSVNSIGPYAFFRCKSLKKITIPQSVKSIEKWTFSICSSLKQIKILSPLSSIEEGVFFNCTSLTEISVPSGTKIGYQAFGGCSSLQHKPQSSKKLVRWI